MTFTATTRGLGPFTPTIQVTFDDNLSEFYTVGPDQDTEEKAFDIALGIHQFCRNGVIERLRNVEGFSRITLDFFCGIV